MTKKKFLVKKEYKMKNILFGSVVAAALIFSGCNGSSSSSNGEGDNNETNKTQKDTTPPTVKTSISGKPGDEVEVATDESGVKNIDITGAGATYVSGGKVKLADTEGDYTITVKAEDTKGNVSDETNVSVSVKADNPGSGGSDDKFTISVGGAKWTPLYVDNDDANTSKGEIDGRISRTEASQVCQNLGGTLPTIEQLESNVSELANKFDIVNINKVNGTSYPVTVFTTTENKNFVFDINTTTNQATGDGYENNYDGTSAYFYTCVKTTN